MALIYVACCVVLFMNRQTVLNSYGIQTSFSKKNGFRQRCATQKVKHELGDWKLTQLASSRMHVRCLRVRARDSGGKWRGGGCPDH